MTNPAGADRQLLGLYDRTQDRDYRRGAWRAWLKRAMVVSSHDGLGRNQYFGTNPNIRATKMAKFTTYDITPEELGLARLSDREVMGGDAGSERSDYSQHFQRRAARCLP